VKDEGNLPGRRTAPMSHVGISSLVGRDMGLPSPTLVYKLDIRGSCGAKDGTRAPWWRVLGVDSCTAPTVSRGRITVILGSSNTAGA